MLYTWKLNSVLLLSHCLVNISTTNIDKVTSIFFSKRRSSIDKHTLTKFYFQPNINVETTLMNVDDQSWWTLTINVVSRLIHHWCVCCEVFSVSRLHIHKVFEHSWEFSRKRCSFRWLKPRGKRVSNFNPYGSKMLKILFSNGRMKDNSLCLSVLIDSEFIILGSRWNDSSREAWEKEGLKNSISQL